MSEPGPLPTGVRAIAALFALAGAYLTVAGMLMLIRPGLIGMAAGAFLLFGLELAGPYMFLLVALAAGGIAFGLLRRSNLARRVGILASIAGIVMLVPPVSAAATLIQVSPLVRGGLGIMVRVIVVWYLSRSDTADQFQAQRDQP
jgi:hypothetical protein